jgi:hypothetical protein
MWQNFNIKQATKKKTKKKRKRNKIATRPSNSPRRPQITRTLGRQMGHEIQRKEMLHNEQETEIELLLPTRSAHSRTSKDKSILRT